MKLDDLHKALVDCQDKSLSLEAIEGFRLVALTYIRSRDLSIKSVGLDRGFVRDYLLAKQVEHWKRYNPAKAVNDSAAWLFFMQVVGSAYANIHMKKRKEINAAYGRQSTI